MQRLGSIVVVVAIVAAGVVTAGATEARANTLRFSTTQPGGILATGNTLGLSKDTGVNAPGTRDSIGTFVSLDFLSVDGSYPNGTTADWHQNGSSAFLDLREGTELGFTDVLYAELIWGGSFNYVDDVTADLDDAVTLETDGATLSVSPDPATALTIAQTAATGFAVNYYMRSADVTAFVRAHKAGEYSVRGVPATQNEAINSLNAAGWTLVVAFRDDAEPLRNLSVFVGGSFVDEDTTVDYSVDGFCAPPSGTINGRVAVSAIEGDANLVGDQFLIAQDAAGTFVNLSGPNNPANNFFCSQMNDQDGVLDTNGTFGLANQNAAGGANIAGGRQGWDVTEVPVSSSAGQLSAGQTSAVLRTITTGDSYVPTLAAFQIDVNAPNLTTSTLTPDRNAVVVGDTLTVTSTAINTGAADATSLTFTLPVPQGLTLTRFTSDGVDGDSSGQPVSQAVLGSGVGEGNLAPGQQRSVVVTLEVTGAPGPGLFTLEPVWGFEYVTCAGTTPESETYTRATTVDFIEPQGGEGEGEGDVGEGEGEGDVGEGEGEGDVGEGEGEGDGVIIGEGEGDGGGVGIGDDGAGAKKGCGCSSEESPAAALGAGFALFGLALVGRRRGSSKR